MLEQISGQAGRYVLVGGFNTGIGLCFIYAFLFFFQLSDVVANFLGYAFGMLVSYAMHRTWTFQHSGAVSASLPRFVLVTVVAYFANLGVVMATHRLLSVNVYIAQLFGVGVYVVIGFLGNRYLSFRS